MEHCGGAEEIKKQINGPPTCQLATVHVTSQFRATLFLQNIELLTLLHTAFQKNT